MERTSPPDEKNARQRIKRVAWIYGGYAGVVAALGLVCHVLLPALGLTPRLWLQYAWTISAFLLAMLGLFGFVGLLLHYKERGLAIASILLTLAIGFFVFPFALFVGSSWFHKQESLVEKQGRQVWAVASMGFDTHVSFYDPVNAFVMRRNGMEPEYYEGTYNPYQRGEAKNPYTFSGVFVSAGRNSVQEVYEKGGAALLFEDGLAPGECRGRYVSVDATDPSRIAYMDIQGQYGSMLYDANLNTLIGLQVQTEDEFRQPKEIRVQMGGEEKNGVYIPQIRLLHRLLEDESINDYDRLP